MSDSSEHEQGCPGNWGVGAICLCDAIQRDKAREECASIRARVQELEADKQALAKQTLVVIASEQELRKALEWYAMNSQPPCDCCGLDAAVLQDGGDRARAALARTPAADSAEGCSRESPC